MMPSRRAFPVVSLLVAGVVLQAARPHYGGTLRIETSDASAIRHVNALAFETLTTADPPRGVRPLLATHWHGEESDHRWTFELRRGVTLHDGSALQPAQVAAALQAAHADWHVHAQDNAVVIDAGPAPDLPSELADAANAIVISSNGGVMIGSGPFRVERVAAGLITLRAHDRRCGPRIASVGRPHD